MVKEIYYEDVEYREKVENEFEVRSLLNYLFFCGVKSIELIRVVIRGMF